MKKSKISLAAGTGLVLLLSIIWQHYNSNKLIGNISAQKPTEPGIVYNFYTKPESFKPLPAPAPERALRLPILMYHHVGELPENPNATRQDLTVPTEEFATQVKWLSDNGYHSIHLEDLKNYLAGKFTMPTKPIIFTFDDGYADVFINAEPILKKYNFTGSFAIITQFPGTQEGDNIYATWENIKEAYQQGNEIVSHTQNHFDGSNAKFTEDYIKKNLCASKADLRQNLGIDTDVLIYPYGHYTLEYIKQAKACGFSLGITVHEGNKINLNNPMEIPRIRVHGRQDFEKFKRLIAE